MTRKLFIFCWVISLLLCVVFLCMWVGAAYPYRVTRSAAGGRYVQVDTFGDPASYVDHGLSVTTVNGWPTASPWSVGGTRGVAVYPRHAVAGAFNAERVTSDDKLQRDWSPATSRNFGPVKTAVGTVDAITMAELSPGAGLFTITFVGPPMAYRTWEAPYWFLALLTAILPAAGAVAAGWRLSRRVRQRLIERAPARGFDVTV